MNGHAVAAVVAFGAAAAVVLVALALRPVAQPARETLFATDGERVPPRSSPAESTATIEMLDDIARSIRSGLSLHAAVAVALAAQPNCIRPVGRLLRGGSTLPDALRVAMDAADRSAPGAHPHSDEHLVLQTLSACLRSGGHLAEPIERAASVLRERRAWRAERRAQSAQARLSAAVMTLLPVGFATWGAVTSEQVRTAYVTSSIAATCAVVGLALNALGWWWMRSLVDGRSP